MRLKFRHHGPGPHRSGSPQSVHGKGGKAKWQAEREKGKPTSLAAAVPKAPPGLPYSAPDAVRVVAEGIVDRQVETILGSKNKVAVARYVKETLAVLGSWIKREDVVIWRGEKGALSIATEGRFKTQFETGDSAGAYDPQGRRTAEENGLGVPRDIPDTARPVYGALGTQGSGYGRIGFHMKDEVRARCTVTVGDSFSGMADGHKIGTPLLKPGKGSIAIGGLVRNIHDNKYDKIAEYGSYIEVQVHGGVRLADVKKVTLLNPVGPRMLIAMVPIYRQLKAKNVPIEFSGWSAGNMADIERLATE